jgi:hypothetical protein
VQDRIRAVGLDVGAGGYFARSPGEVEAKGFGDCKDKALLLKTVREALEIEAEVALASLDTGYGLKDGLPRTGAFDHMIVAARLRGRWVFMDPTLTLQGGTGGTAVEPDYGYVLPITEGPDDLVLIEANRQPQFHRSMTETFRFRDDGLYLEVETVLRARSADDEREAWATKSISDIADTYLRYYQSFYPGIRALGDPVLTDRRRGNYVSIRERYLIPPDALHSEALYRDFPFVSDSVFGGYPEPPITDRRDPLRIAHRTRVEHNIPVIDGPIEFTAPDQEFVSGPAFYDRFTARATPGGGLRLRWVYETRARSVPAAQAAAVVQDAEAARGFRAWYWDLGDAEVQRAPADGFTAPAD